MGSTPPSRPRPLDIAILGLGNVASALCRLLADGHGRDRHGRVLFRIVAAASRRRGVLLRADGVDPAELAVGAAGPSARGGAPAVDSAAPALGGADQDAGFAPWPQGWDGVDFARNVGADVLVELTTLDVASGQPAIRHIEAALQSGKHVVTANKGPIAWAYRSLEALARKYGRRFLFEATVMDGAPVFGLHRHCLRGCRVTGISGILNSTTNVILGRMAAGDSYREGLAAAQAMGVAETDPTLDVDGWDPAVKLCALANVLMGAEVTPPQVRRMGVRHLTPAHVRAADSRGAVIKLVCRAEWSGEGADPLLTVGPEEVPAGHPYAAVAGTSSILTVSTDLLGDLTITEQAPGLAQTAYGVLVDLLEIAGSV